MEKIYGQYQAGTLSASHSGRTSRRRRRRSSMFPWFLAVTIAMAAVMIVTGRQIDPAGAVPPGETAADAPSLQTACLPAAADSERRLSLIYQNPELPNGCEVTSLAMLLEWAGCPIDKVELAERYLPKEDFAYTGGDRLGPDPDQAYAGDPSGSGGWYCFEDPIVRAGNAWLKAQNSGFRAVSLTGLTQKELEGYLDLGIPLAVWVTLNYAPPKLSSFQWTLPDGSRYTPYSNLHCVVLAGWSDGDYQIADPISGRQRVSPSLFWSSFEAMGRRAAAVLPDESRVRGENS